MRLSHPRFVCAKGMSFGRFAQRSFTGRSASCENASGTWRAESVQKIGESKRKAFFSQILLRLDVTAQSTRAHMCPYFITAQHH